jgi:hypothetical protein
MSSSPRLLSSVQHPEPEARPVGLLDPEPEHVLLPIAIDPQREVDGLVPHDPFVADLHPQRVEDHHGVDPIERPLLPRGHLVEHGVGDRADHRRGDLDLVELFQVALDLADAHSPRVEREHIGIELREPAHPLGHELRRERARAVPRNVERERPGLGEHGLGTRAVPMIGLARRLRLPRGVP